MAQSGLGSRRGLEKHIDSGRVLVNGKPAKLGCQVEHGDMVEFENTQFRVEEQGSGVGRVIMHNKPEGVVCTRSDPEGRRTVFDHMPKIQNGRWITIGRLDINTTGLLLLTTDGELANAMMHPSNGVDREYACRIHGKIRDEQLAVLKEGVELADGMARFSDIQAAGASGQNYWYHVVIMEGRNREVRRLWASQGAQVSRLKRVRYGPVFLPKGLRMGKYQELSEQDHGVIREDIGLPPLASHLVIKPLRGNKGHATGKRRRAAQGSRPKRN